MSPSSYFLKNVVLRKNLFNNWNLLTEKIAINFQMPITDKYFIEKMLCNQYMVLLVLRSFYLSAVYQSCHLKFFNEIIFYDCHALN